MKRSENQRLTKVIGKAVLAWFFLLGLTVNAWAQDKPREDTASAPKPAATGAPQETEKSQAEPSITPTPTESTQESTPNPQAVTTELATEKTPSSVAKFDPERTFFSGEAPQTIEDLRELERKFAEVTEMVKPATVNIQMNGSQGSGVVVTADGYILTAAHVIGQPNGTATVTFPDKKRYTATTLGVANRLDSGILKINEGQADEFPHIEMGLSSNLKPGQWILAIGHPGGIDEKRGLVVRAGRILRATDSVIQTDCTLVGGDSGGPLVDLNGEVVGIHSRIGMNLWDNLHVPVDAYSEKWDQMVMGLVLDGRPRLGFTIEEDSTRIERITKDMSADKAGLKVGDIVKKIEGHSIDKPADLKAAVGDLLPNQKIKIVVQRDEDELTLDMVVGPTR